MRNREMKRNDETTKKEERNEERSEALVGF